MVPAQHGCALVEGDSPRIRGDGPDLIAIGVLTPKFSPYSRGWSLGGVSAASLNDIVPVFAGMVRHPGY